MAETVQSGISAEPIDPRILRSRRMLMEALLSLLNKKEFDGISIQEIADEAGLNRATFYLHYPDKNALLQAMTTTRFRDLVARRGLHFTDCDADLRSIALGVCDYLAETTGCPSQLSKMPLEASIIPVIEAIFLEGATHHPPKADVDSGLVATVVAWAIFGAARHWFETPDRMPAEEVATAIAATVKPILVNAADQ